MPKPIAWNRVINVNDIEGFMLYLNNSTIMVSSE